MPNMMKPVGKPHVGIPALLFLLVCATACPAGSQTGPAALLSTTIFFLLTLSIAAPPARAGQGSPESQLREVRGSTVDRNERPVISAVIYLQNVSTLTVNTQISDDKGQYHFSGLDGSVDYKLHAEHDDQTSSKHTISVFNRHKDMVVILKVDKSKKKSDKKARAYQMNRSHSYEPKVSATSRFSDCPEKRGGRSNPATAPRTVKTILPAGGLMTPWIGLRRASCTGFAID